MLTKSSIKRFGEYTELNGGENMNKKSIIIVLMIAALFFIPKEVHASDTVNSTNDSIASTVIGQITFNNENNQSDVGAAAGSADYASTVTLAADRLRTQIINRQAECTVYYKADSASFDNDKFTKLAEQIYNSALKHTGISDQGDYLRWGAIASVNISGKTTSQGLVITYNFTYYITENQELELQKKLVEIMKELNLDGRSNYEKVVAIYNYICNHVAYDYENDADNSYGLKRTAYGAIFKGKANCQGYSVLFYRMALQEGIDCRIIGGYGINRSHGWNIVKLGNYYYYVDATWDAEQGTRTYFLKGQNNFPDHTPDAEYKGYDFTNKYPVDTKDYKPNSTSGSCGKNLTWKLSENHVLTISGTGYMYTYSESVPAPWDYVKEDIQKIVFESSVQFIGEYAFANCTEVKEVTLGSSLFKIGEAAFKNCSKLEKVDFPKRLAVIQSKAFYGCKQLKRFTFSGEYPTIESYAFNKVSATAYYPYSDSTWNPIILTPTSHQFGGFITWKVWSGKAEDDPEAKSGTCGNGVTWELQTDLLRINGRGKMNDWTDPMTCPWYNYRNIIKKVSIDSSVENIGQNAFSNISNLSKIEIPNKITSIGGKAFDQCTSLKKVEFKGSLPTISSDAFNGVSTEGYYPTEADSSWDSIKRYPENYQYGGKIVWKQHEYFILKTHNNSFGHDSDNFTADYSTDYADKLLANAKKKAEKERLKKQMKEKWEGSCFGIETAIIQNKRRVLGYNKDFYFLNNPRADSKLLNIINYYQLTQYLKAFSPTIKTQKNSKSTSLKTFLESFVSQAKLDQEKESLSIFDYYYIDDNKENTGHAVILCGYEYGDFDRDGKKEHRLKIYDCNNRSGYYYMYVSDDYTSFTYTNDAIRDGIRLENCYTQLDYVSGNDISTKDYYNLGLTVDDLILTPTPIPGIDHMVGSAGTTIPSNAITLHVYADKPFTMMNANGQTLIYKDNTFTGTMKVYDYRMVGSQNTEIYITVDPSDSFSVSDIKDRFYLGAEIDGHYYAAKSDGAKSVTLSKTKGVELKGSNLFTFEVTRGTDLENSDLISISGTAEADVCLNSDNDKVQFTSDKNCSDLKVETYKDTDKKEQSIQQKTNSVTFTDNQDNTINIDTKPVKKNINSCQISFELVRKYIYDGKEKKPEVIVKDESSQKLTLSKDYKISYSDNIDAGEGNVTITGLGNYEGQVEKHFSIEKAEQNFELKKQKYDLYVGDTETIRLENAIGKVEFSSKDPEIVSVDSDKGNIKGLREGRTVIYITADGSDENGKQNYKSCQKEIEVIVKEKPSDSGSKGENIPTDKDKENVLPSQPPYYRYNYIKYTYYYIRLYAPTIKKVQSKKKGQLRVKWSKRAQVDGYQIQCSTKKNFKKNKKTVLIKKNVTSAQIKKLKRKKRYYVRIRSYKQFFFNRYYSKWSKVKTINKIK